MNKYESHALDQVMCSYPADMSYYEVLNLISDDEAFQAHNDKYEDSEDDYLAICEEYENEWNNVIVDKIESIRKSVERAFPCNCEDK